MTKPESFRLSIGALAQATGIAVETLRTWERRYGLGHQATRDAGGQRRYSSDEVRRLRLVRSALSSGHRAAAVVSLPEDELMTLLDVTADPEPVDTRASRDWLQLVQNWDFRGLGAELNQRSAETSCCSFLDGQLGPFIQQLGRAWAEGLIDLSQEHLTTECLVEFLSRRWAALNTLNTGKRVVFATLPRERHNLGLHMAAWALCTVNCRAVFLGADTPLLDIARTVQMSQAKYVMLSASQCSVLAENTEQLRLLQSALPVDTQIVVGGDGFDVPQTSNVHRITSFQRLVVWFSHH